MSSIFKRFVPPAPTAALDTAKFVEQVSEQLRSYAGAVDAPGQQAAVDATRHLFARFERGKSGPQAVDLQRPGASLKPAKLDSLARKLAETPGYLADAAPAFVSLVSPALAGRLGLVSALSNEVRLAAEARTTAQTALALALTQAEQEATALLASAKQAAQQEAETLLRSAGGKAAAIKGELSAARGEVEELRGEREALEAECAEIEAKRATYFTAIPSDGVAFKAGGTTFHIAKTALEGSGYLSSLASGEYTERPDRSGAIKVSDITANHLEAVIEFLEEDKISDLKSFGQERLLKVAQRFGNDAMEFYVKDPKGYRAEQQRLARLAGVAGPVAIPEGFVRIEAGEFTMGSPAGEVGRFDNEVQHQVTLTRPYLLKSTPVTQAEWQTLMGNNPSRFSQGNEAAAPPVENVSWYDAVAFCNALSVRDGLSPCYVLHGQRGTAGSGNFYVERVEAVAGAPGYRLPTEAEWEHAARAGSTEPTHGPRSEVAWFRDNAGNITHPVGQKAANAWGLSDMLGNVFEWTADHYGALSHASAQDPQGSGTGSSRVIRGGSAYGAAQVVRAAFRSDFAPDERFDFLGLRPARSVDSSLNLLTAVQHPM